MNGHTGLYKATTVDKTDVVEFLLATGADINYINKVNNQTALHIVAELGYLTLTQFLIEKNAEIDLKSSDGGMTALHYASKLSNGHTPQIRQNGVLLVRMCRGESHLSQKLAKASVRESGEYHKWPHFGECESGESVTAFWRIWRIFKLGRFRYKKKIFLGIKRSSLPSPNSPNSPNLP